MRSCKELLDNQSFFGKQYVEIFSDYSTNQGLANSIANKYPNNANLEEYNYSIMPVLGRGRHGHEFHGESSNRHRKFYTDGNLAFMLMCAKSGELPVGIAITSFTLEPVESDSELLNDKDYRYFPRILQIQGLTYRSDRSVRRLLVLECLQAVHCERVMVELHTAFALAFGYPCLALLPAEANPNRNKKDFDLARMKTRYNGTARRHGFDKNQTGLYVKTLISK